MYCRAFFFSKFGLTFKLSAIKMSEKLGYMGTILEDGEAGSQDGENPSVLQSTKEKKFV